MSISLKTHKMLWGRSGGTCAFPGCNLALFFEEADTDDVALIGEEAHIVARNVGGPRGVSNLSPEQRDKYDNLILLCSNHHKIIDGNPDVYTTEKLKDMKHEHEKKVFENLADKSIIKDGEIYASIIEEFMNLVYTENWEGWTSFLLATPPSFSIDVFKSLENVPKYVISRLWPKRFPELENAFYNFKNILGDLIHVFNCHIEDRSRGGNFYWVEKFYKGHYHDKELEKKLVEEYHYHNDLLGDLTLELTRALNYICDKIREFIYPGFRMKEGVYLVSISNGLLCFTKRVEYRGGERIDFPYLGLREFMTERASRDYCFGEGEEEQYFLSGY